MQTETAIQNQKQQQKVHTTIAIVPFCAVYYCVLGERG